MPKQRGEEKRKTSYHYGGGDICTRIISTFQTLSNLLNPPPPFFFMHAYVYVQPH